MITATRQEHLDAVAGMRREYLRQLGGRPEPYLEEWIGYDGVACALLQGSRTIGYAITTGGQRGRRYPHLVDTLLQLHIGEADVPLATAALDALREEALISRALVLTRDRLALSTCMDRHKSVSVDCYVFEEGPLAARGLPELSHCAFQQAAPADSRLIREVTGDFHDFLHFTLEDSIAKGEIFMLLEGIELLGTGVIGPQWHGGPYVDIGMFVSRSHRRRGAGTHILLKLREYCRDRGWIPGASCQAGNTASRRTLERAGMISRDRILEIRL